MRVPDLATLALAMGLALTAQACTDSELDSDAGVAADAALPCYSPLQNVERAYEQGARGCPCGRSQQSICIGGAALICGLPRALASAEPDRWHAVEDGPCAPAVPPDPNCAGGEVRASAAACLEAFDSCYVLAGGEYCGVR